MIAPTPISVVIRTSNSERTLQRLLARLKTGSGDEIIVVDTDSRDQTIALAQQAGARVVSNHEAFNYSRTLNLGFSAAGNPWVLAISSHCVPIDEDILGRYRAVLASLAEPPAVIYGSSFMSRSQWAASSKTVVMARDLGSIHLPQGGNANALYARDAWVRRSFDETLFTGEDLAWRRWALSERLLCVGAPEAGVLYRHPGGPVYRFRKAFEEVRTSAPHVVPMSFLSLGLGIVQGTRRLLWDEHEVGPWIGQVAHQLGAFAASRSTH